MKSFFWFLATVAVIALFYGWSSDFSTEPFISVKKWVGSMTRMVADSSREIAPTKTESYYIPQNSGTSKIMGLKTIASWTGDTSREISFKTNKAPWVLNAGGIVSGTIANKLRFEVNKVLYTDILISLDSPGKTSNNVYQILSTETGDFVIKVNASGAKWWIKIGVEK